MFMNGCCSITGNSQQSVVKYLLSATINLLMAESQLFPAVLVPSI